MREKNREEKGKKEGEERQIVYSADISEKIPEFNMPEIMSEVLRVSKFNYIYYNIICVTVQQCDTCPVDPGSPVSLGVE